MKTQYVITTEHDYLSNKGTKVEVVAIAETMEEIPSIIRRSIAIEREKFPLLDQYLRNNPETADIPIGYPIPNLSISYGCDCNLFVVKITPIDRALDYRSEDLNAPEVLTIGLLKEMIGNRNIPVLQSIIRGRDDSEGIFWLEDIGEYIATTFWSRDDIANRLAEQGYEPSQDNIDKVLDTGDLKYLGDCTDADWAYIDRAIEDADDLKKRKPLALNGHSIEVGSLVMSSPDDDCFC